jgi:ribosome maturation factor RimP
LPCQEEVESVMSTADRVRDLVTPLLEAADLDLYDLDLTGGVLQVLVDREGGADIAAVAKLARSISRALDEHDPIDGTYTLEVSTPGLERPLRTPDHFRRAVGSTVKVKTKPGTAGERRMEGTVASADDDAVTVTGADGSQRTFHYDEIERARTTFEWGGAAKQERKARA